MKKYPNMTVVGPEYSQNSPTTAEADARALILAHKNLVGIPSAPTSTTPRASARAWTLPA